jgi:hypothetical protein
MICFEFCLFLKAVFIDASIRNDEILILVYAVAFLLAVLRKRRTCSGVKCKLVKALLWHVHVWKYLLAEDEGWKDLEGRTHLGKHSPYINKLL